jgi:hypothetical protein
VTIHFFVRTFAIAPQDLYKLKLDALQSCSCSSSTIVASDQEERGVGRPAGRSADSIHKPSVSTPLFVFDNASLSSIRRIRKEACMLEAEIAGSKGQLIVKDMHSGSFSEREALTPRLTLQDEKR